jgi:Trypsin-like peptidase domain
MTWFRPGAFHYETVFRTVNKSAKISRTFLLGQATTMLSSALLRAKWILFFLAILCSQPLFAQSSSAPAPGSGSPYRVARSISGASGHEDNNKFVMDDPKSLFSTGKDTKVIVYFEWEGPLGQHHFEGLWKSPEGKIVLISDFRYEAKTPHYSGYWTMLLSDGTPSGEWNLEARIDGEPAGSYSFVVTGSSAPPAAPRPVVLGSADLYKLAIAATVTIEKLTADGVSAGKASGFWVGEGEILTAFENIDGASSLRVSLRDGTQLQTDQLAVWNRWQDWAILKVNANSKSVLKRGPEDPPNVGDRCVFLEWSPAGPKLADGSITGTNSFPKAGARLIVASGVTPASIGGPLLDEFGNYVGIIGGSIVPGGDPVRILALMSDPNPAGGVTLDSETTGMAVPHTLLPESSTNEPAAKLADLAARGEFALPVLKSNSVSYFTLSSAVDKEKGSVPFPRDARQVFSRRDSKIAAYVTWQNSVKEKVVYSVRLFNADNKPLTDSKPREASLGSGRYMSTSWDIPIGTLNAGIYRLDLIVNDKTAAREFFRITE